MRSVAFPFLLFLILSCSQKSNESDFFKIIKKNCIQAHLTYTGHLITDFIAQLDTTEAQLNKKKSEFKLRGYGELRDKYFQVHAKIMELISHEQLLQNILKNSFQFKNDEELDSYIATVREEITKVNNLNPESMKLKDPQKTMNQACEDSL